MRVFYRKNLAKTQETTAVIQYILTSAQSFGSQGYYNKSLITILGLAGVLFCKIRRHGQNGLLSFVPKKILTWVPREAVGGLKVRTGKRLQPYYHFIYKLFCYFLFLSAKVLFPCQAILEIISTHRHCGSKPSETLKNILNKPDS